MKKGDILKKKTCVETQTKEITRGTLNWLVMKTFALRWDIALHQVDSQGQTENCLEEKKTEKLKNQLHEKTSSFGTKIWNEILQKCDKQKNRINIIRHSDSCQDKNDQL